MNARERAGTLGAALILAAAIVAAGCSESEDAPTAPTPPAVAPEPTSAVNVATRVGFALAQRDTAMTRGLYTYDYAFLLHPLDVGTGGDTDGLLTRDEELTFARLLRVVPPASLSFEFLGAVAESPDGRPGKDPRVHRRVDASAQIVIAETTEQYVISGALTFFAVRGDSAAIDDAVRGASTLPDSARWYVERIEDGTGGPLAVAVRTSARTVAARNSTLGGYKLIRLQGGVADRSAAGSWRHVPRSGSIPPEGG